MTKYRILKKEYADGRTRYIAQRKSFLFWIPIKTIDWLYHSVVEQYSLKDAEDAIKLYQQSVLENKVKSVQVCQGD